MLRAAENGLGVSHIISVAASEILKGDGEEKECIECRVDPFECILREWGEVKRQRVINSFEKENESCLS